MSVPLSFIQNHSFKFDPGGNVHAATPKKAGLVRNPIHVLFDILPSCTTWKKKNYIKKLH